MAEKRKFKNKQKRQKSLKREKLRAKITTFTSIEVEAIGLKTPCYIHGRENTQVFPQWTYHI